MTDAELDQQFAALRGVEPPPALVERTLAQYHDLLHETPSSQDLPTLPRLPHREVHAEPPRPPTVWRWRVVPVLALAAGLALMVVPSEPTVGDPAQWVARGVNDAHLALDVQVTLRNGASAQRYSPGAAVRVGEVLSLRVGLSAPARVVVRRDGVVFFEQELPAGEHDLETGWQVEAGEVAGELVVEAQGEPALGSRRVTVPVGAAILPEGGP